MQEVQNYPTPFRTVTLPLNVPIGSRQTADRLLAGEEPTLLPSLFDGGQWCLFRLNFISEHLPPVDTFPPTSITIAVSKVVLDRGWLDWVLWGLGEWGSGGGGRRLIRSKCRQLFSQFLRSARAWTRCHDSGFQWVGCRPALSVRNCHLNYDYCIEFAAHCSALTCVFAATIT